MKTTIPQLRRTIRRVIKEAASGSWPEFIELVQDGDEELALEWLKELFDGAGMELNRELENEFFMIASEEGPRDKYEEPLWKDLDRAWKVIQSGDY